jgi:hypothetical protein
MGGERSPIDRIVAAIAFPFRLAGRGVGTFVAVALLASTALVLVVASSMAWFLGVLLLGLAVDLPVVTVGLATAIGFPPVVAGVPVLYPAVGGVLTALALGWPDPDYEGEPGSGPFRKV